MRYTAIRRGAAIATLGWLTAQVAAVLATATAAVGPLTYMAVSAVYIAGALICHQRPERSFHVWGAQWPVCARCLGLYAGAAIGAVLAACTPSSSIEFRAVSAARTILAIAILPTAATLAYEWTTGITPSNVMRMGTALPAGAVVCWLVVAAVTPRAAVGVH